MTSTEEFALQALLDSVNAPFCDSVLERVRLLVEQVERLQTEMAEAGRRTDREHLLTLLDEDRNVVLHLLADACLDEADEELRHDLSERLRAQAKGWGWLAMHRKWPQGWRDNKWSWTVDSAQDRRSHTLPPSIRSARPGGTPYIFDSPRAALLWVIELIASGQWKPEE